MTLSAMPELDTRLARVHGARRAGWTPATALFWRLFLVNGFMLLAAAVVLVFSPITVSRRSCSPS